MLASMLLGIAAAASVGPRASDEVARPAATQAASTQTEPSSERIICRSKIVTGTRTNNTRACGTAAQWRTADEIARLREREYPDAGPVFAPPIGGSS